MSSKKPSIRAKWHKTFKSVKSGFKKGDEPEANNSRAGQSNVEYDSVADLQSVSSVDEQQTRGSARKPSRVRQHHYRGHILIVLGQERLCAVCSRMVAVPDNPNTKGMKCDLCKISVHLLCQEDVRECKAVHDEMTKQKFMKYGRETSISSDHSNDASTGASVMGPGKNQDVDPVYYLLKQAKQVTGTGAPGGRNYANGT